nr:MAG TPA: hypothetical protein [Caudoviricetes sp.]
MAVTYSDLYQYTLVLIGIVTICLSIGKKK